jgi:NAD+ synthase
MATTVSELQINLDVAIDILTRFLVNEVRKAGFERGVIGLSGGIDSSVSAFLAARALGPDNVLGVLMPYKTSSPASVADARTVVEQLGIHSREIPITPMADAYFAMQGEMSNLRRGNVMARLRMIVLYDQSEVFHGLVIGTSNKTELLLGYGTLYGDTASAINPLGDLYKTQVRQIAAALGVPEAIQRKAPSADLWINQTDESELGFTYEQVDRLLFYLVDERYSIEDCVALGFERSFVEQVARRIQRTQFKRRMPVIAKVSQRTIDRDFRYPRDWGL